MREISDISMEYARLQRLLKLVDKELEGTEEKETTPEIVEWKRRKLRLEVQYHTIRWVLGVQPTLHDYWAEPYLNKLF